MSCTVIERDITIRIVIRELDFWTSPGILQIDVSSAVGFMGQWAIVAL